MKFHLLYQNQFHPLIVQEKEHYVHLTMHIFLFYVLIFVNYILT